MHNPARAISDTLVWWPLALGAGMAVFFAWPYDPPVWPCALASVILLALWLRVRRLSAIWRYGVLAVLLIMAGFTVAGAYTEHMYSPRWHGGDRPVTIEGVIETITPVPKGVRVLLRDLVIPEYAGAVPAKVRLVCRVCTADNTPVGARVRVRGVLSPPAGAARTDGFDFRFMAYFKQIGAVGFMFGAPEILAHGTDKPSDFFARHRVRLTEIITAQVSDPDTRALAVALLTGVSTGLPDKLREAYQSSGLAHIYSVSGLHLGFVAGFLFFLFRGVLALFPSVALRYPTKKIAAIMAMAAVVLFTLFAGDSVPTWRSLLMISLALLAVVTDRFAFTLRVVALSACVILLLKPDMLFSISFQLSYAAVTVLVAWMEWVERVQARRTGGYVSRHGRIIRDVLITSLLASIATLPFILHSFGRISPYAVLANLVGVPWTGFVIMPLVLLCLLGFMAGLSGAALAILTPTLAVLNGLAYEVASWPMADMRVAAVPSVMVIVCAVALYAACVHPRKWTLGVVVIAYLALIVLSVMPRALPRAYLSDKGLLAVRVDNTLWISAANKDKFVRNQWLVEQGLSDKDLKTLPLEGPVGSVGACDRAACVVGDILFVRRALGVQCRAGLTIIAPDLAVPRAACPEAAAIIDHKGLKTTGTQIQKNQIWQAVNGQAQEPRVWVR